MTGGSSVTKTKNVKFRRLKSNISQQEEPEISESDMVNSKFDDLTELECGSGDDEEDLEEDATMEPHTLSRKRKRKEEKTPRNIRHNKTLARPTPHSIYGISSSQLLNFKTSMAHLPKDPWLRAMHALHVGSRPDTLPCREEEFSKVLRCIGELLEEGSGGCVCKSIIIHSSLGVGSVKLYVFQIFRESRELGRLQQCIPSSKSSNKWLKIMYLTTSFRSFTPHFINQEINPFSYVEINGLKIAEPAAAYNLLWEGVSGHDAEKDGHLHIGAKESLKALTRYFSGGNRGPEGHAW